MACMALKDTRAKALISLHLLNLPFSSMASLPQPRLQSGLRGYDSFSSGKACDTFTLTAPFRAAYPSDPSADSCRKSQIYPLSSYGGQLDSANPLTHVCSSFTSRTQIVQVQGPSGRHRFTDSLKMIQIFSFGPKQRIPVKNRPRIGSSPTVNTRELAQIRTIVPGPPKAGCLPQQPQFSQLACVLDIV